MDPEVTVGELRRLVAKFVKEREWESYHNPKDLAIAISIEAGELLELFLWRDFTEHSKLEGQHVEKVMDELADMVIYCLMFANAQGWDLSDAIKVKIRKDELKYPIEKYRGHAEFI